MQSEPARKTIRSKIKRLFSVAFMAMILSVGAYAAVAGSLPLPAFADNGSAICSAQSNASTNIGTCVNRIYVISLAAGGFIAVLLVIVAGYLYMTGGEGVKTAKKLIISAISGLVILFGAFAFLNTINPDLTSFTGFSLPNLTCSGAVGSSEAGKNLCAAPSANLITGAAGTTPSTSSSGNAGANPASQSAAQQVLADNKAGSITLAPSGDCSGNNPLKNVTDISQGNATEFDGPTLCAQGTTNISSSVLTALNTLAQTGIKVTVTSLTSGHHSDGKNSANGTDPHYLGLAVDVVPGTGASQSSVIQSFMQSGTSKIGVECDNSAGHQYLPVTSPSTATSACPAGSSGYHIHAQWSS
jgi:hypothetical protein